MQIFTRGCFSKHGKLHFADESRGTAPIWEFRVMSAAREFFSFPMLIGSVLSALWNIIISHDWRDGNVREMPVNEECQGMWKHRNRLHPERRSLGTVQTPLPRLVVILRNTNFARLFTLERFPRCYIYDGKLAKKTLWAFTDCLISGTSRTLLCALHSCIRV